MKTSFSQLFTGTVLIGLGLGFLFDSLGIIDFGGIVGDWWPALIILAAIASFVSNRRNILIPFTGVIVGTLLLMRELDFLTFSIASLIWPAVLIIIGLSIVFNHIAYFGPKDANESKKDSTSLFVMLAGIEAKNISDRYRGGRLTAFMGGITLDLRNAQLSDDATLDIFTLMGGVELRIPDDWKVNADGVPILGGWEDKTSKPTDTKAPVLNVHGTCIMGGIEIKN
ncbi:hypothetical protein H7Y40_01635 [Pedobacter sp.]|nr:hypothetical protein [Candidatus Saccharibacteria bacterium]